jgi:predicted RNA-binding Zn-ribbon protein involved in translation (DUF1610 family)
MGRRRPQKKDDMDVTLDELPEDEQVVMKCPQCGNEFTLGFNGCYNDEHERDECDRCAGVERDMVGYAWLKDEQETEFDDGSIVPREVAFSRDYLEELERGDFIYKPHPIADAIR